MAAKAMGALRRVGKATRSVEESVSFAVGSRIRVEILAALHEGTATAKQLSQIVRQPLSTVGHHIAELVKDGSIEVAKTDQVGNLVQHHYCMVRLPYFTDEDIAAMKPEDRQALYALILQASTAEAIASLWAGKMVDDPRVMLAWNRVTLDKQGREELADEEARSWARKAEIEAKATNRRVESGEPGTTYIISVFSYPRSRMQAPEPLSTDET